jgi:hypothetical protein
MANSLPPRRISHTLPASPDFSLFKYKLFYSQGDTDTHRNQPKILYSHDMPHEREMFREGLSYALRSRWQNFLSLIPNDAYGFFGLAYPSWNGKYQDHEVMPLVILYDQSDQGKKELLKQAYSDSQLLSGIAQESGLIMQKIISINGRTTPPPVGYSPRYHADYEKLQQGQPPKLNGLVAVRNWLDRNFGINPSLIKIEVYDNLCYHQDNHMTTWYYHQQPKQTYQTNISKQPRTFAGAIGDLIPKVLPQ